MAVGYQGPHILSSASSSSQWQTGGRDHQAHWLKSNMCRRATCRGLGNTWQWAAVPSAGPVTDSRLHSTIASVGPPQWTSHCQQLRDNGMVLVHLAERGFPWVTGWPISQGIWLVRRGTLSLITQQGVILHRQDTWLQVCSSLQLQSFIKEENCCRVKPWARCHLSSPKAAF